MIKIEDLRFLIAPGPFKECLPAEEVANAIEEGLREIFPEVIIQKLPMCDGGTGFVNRIVEHSNGFIKYCNIKGPLGDRVDAFYGIASRSGKKIGIIESAIAAGLALVPKEMRDPKATSTYGVGELIKTVLDEGCEEIIIGCGDSATNDGGAGLAKALGVRFLNDQGKELPEGGAQLINLNKIDLTGRDTRVLRSKIEVACNLSSVLCGREGTSRIYGPQKGADSKSVELLSRSMDNYAKVVYQTTGKDIRYIPGAGGSGGLAAALYAFMNARLRFSLHVVTDFLNLESYLQNTDIVITGEGRIDKRTASGKVACAVALTAKKYNLPVLAIAGSIADDVGIIYYNGIDHIEPICPGPVSLDQSILNARKWIAEASARVARLLRVGGMMSATNQNRDSEE